MGDVDRGQTDASPGLDPDPHGDLVTVVIPCFNQAHYLSEAIESALEQTHGRVEVVVVDDGSSDNTAAVVARYPEVRSVRQDNQGLASARNAGLREADGAFVLFLDADDLLLPNAIADGVGALREHPGAAFAYGHTGFLMEDGSPPPAPHRPQPVADHYRALLAGCPIMSIASVMFPRATFERHAPFRRSLPAAEDYELYYRIARTDPVHCHGRLVTLYRRHGASMTSGSVRRLLRCNLTALRRERRFVWTRPGCWSAYRAGTQYWRRHYGMRLAAEVQADLQARALRSALLGVATLARWWPRGVTIALSTSGRTPALPEWSPGA